MTASIAVESLVKAYAGRRVVDDVSFEVAPGEVVALLGPNGAGKTTTVEIIEGYRRADGGRVTVLGVEPGRFGRQERARLGLMLQGGGGVDPRLSPLEALRLHAALYDEPRDVGELIELLDLGSAAATRYRRLSGGERQRLGIALALVGRPDVVVLDEPTAGLDVEGRGRLRDLIRDLAGGGVAILLTSHDLVEIERVADRIVIIVGGRVVAAGSPGALGRHVDSVMTMRLAPQPSPQDLELLGATVGGQARAGDDGTVRVHGVEATPEVVRAVATWAAERGILLRELRVGQATFEDRYLELVGANREGMG